MSMSVQNLGVFAKDLGAIQSALGDSKNIFRKVGPFHLLSKPKFPFHGARKVPFYCVSRDPVVSPFLVSVGFLIPKVVQDGVKNWELDAELSMHERLKQVDGVCHPKFIEMGLNSLYMIFDLCTSSDLLEFNKSLRSLSTPPPPWIQDWVCYSVASIMTRCHELQVILRDAKLENFLVSPDPQTHVKIELTDLGSSIYAPEADEKERRRVCGTWLSSPPESFVQFDLFGHSDRADYARDLWQLGTIIFEILTDMGYLNADQVEIFKRGGPIPTFPQYASSQLGRYGHEIRDLMDLNPEARPPAAWIAKRIGDIFLRTFPDSPVSERIRNRPKLSLEQVIASLSTVKTHIGDSLTSKIASYLSASDMGLNSTVTLDQILKRLKEYKTRGVPGVSAI